MNGKLELKKRIGSGMSERGLKVSKSRKKICCPRFSKIMNAGAFLCTEKCPSVRFFGDLL